MGVANIRPVRFTVTFCDQHALENVEHMLKSDFIGIGKCFQPDDPRVLILRPFSDMYEVALATLEEMAEHGILMFVQEFR